MRLASSAPAFRIWGIKRNLPSRARKSPVSQGSQSARMAEITQFIPGDSGFDPEAIAVVCTAYDRASLMLHDRGHARVAARSSPNALLPWPPKVSVTPNACATPRWWPLVFADEGCWFSKKYRRRYFLPFWIIVRREHRRALAPKSRPWQSPA